MPIRFITASLETLFDAVDECVGLLSGQRSGKVMHHFRISIQLSKGSTILGCPSPKDKAFRRESIHHAAGSYSSPT